MQQKRPLLNRFRQRMKIWKARNETEDRGSLERSGLAVRLTKLEREREAERQLAQPIGLKRALKIQRSKVLESNEMCSNEIQVIRKIYNKKQSVTIKL